MELPVARVLVDVGLAHLDRPFDYRVSAEQDAVAVPGSRVRVRFAGQDVDGYLLERVATSDHPGRLAPIRRVVSAEPVLTPAVAALCRAVADRYAGVLSDVLRLAVPPRHARVEKETWAPSKPPEEPVGGSSAEGWDGLVGGRALLRRIRAGEAPRAVWAAVPGTDWPATLSDLVESAVASGRGALVCLPDVRDVRRLADRLGQSWVSPVTVTLTADLGPAPRYRAFLRVVRGDARVVVGTRAAMFAPVRDLGLAVVWDDGDDLHAEPRAPYPHPRQVLALRAGLEEAAYVCGGFAMTAEGAALVESGWAQPVVGTRSAVRAGAPRIHVTGESEDEQLRDPAARAARLPSLALETARDGLRSGPVLVQVPRGGYLPALACVRCRHPARCGRCHGPLALRSRQQRIAVCGWCGQPALRWRCAECGADRYRAPVVGSRRTAEELGRSFAGVPVVSSSAGQVRETVADRPALVVSTPGAEPVAEGGYAAALLLDTWLTLSRPGLRTAEEGLRRWFNAAALVRPADAGGRVVVVGDPAVRQVQALVRWDPQGAAERELAERRAARLPPVARLAVVSGPAEEIDRVQDTLSPDLEVLGPLAVDADSARLVVRVPPAQREALSRALKVLQATRSARKLPHLRVEVDPVELG